LIILKSSVYSKYNNIIKLAKWGFCILHIINKVLLVFSIAFFLFGVSNVLANPHNHGDHQDHLDSIVSPFDSQKKHVSPHCLLMNGAHHQTGKCPHSKAKKDKQSRIAFDCGGKTSGAIPNTSSYSSDYVESYLNRLVYPLRAENIPTTSMLLHIQFIDLLGPPPRFV